MTISSSPSNPPPSRAKRSAIWSILIAAALVSVGGYLLASKLTYRIGFPLDDSWIHQTYARNLALSGQWAFTLGTPSGGSTAPLWSVLIAVGYLIHLAPFLWTYFLGGLFLLFLGIQTEFAVRTLVPGYRGPIPWAGLFVLYEWHMVWASASGMETLLQSCVILATLWLLIQKSSRWILAGLLAGISVWVRPDGLTLLGPILLTAVLVEANWKARSRAVFSALIGFGALFVPYLFFNLALAGTVMPNTFYAKQAEYAAWQAEPILVRIGEGALQFLTGPAILLLPGFIYSLVKSVRSRDWGRISALLWMFGFIGIYLLRLPAYQHGRYLMPAMPVYFLLGLQGFYTFMTAPGPQNRNRWMLKVAWGSSLFLVVLVFWILGMRSYTEDVRFIESEMVASAKWVAADLPPDSLIAAHDIGALGFFSQHQLVDLAGLVSPEVIPFLRDEHQLAHYLNVRCVDYLVAFPDWYPTLTSSLQQVYTTGAPYAPAMGGTNMTVYRWPCR
jgi:hypothetical protein